MTSTPPIDPIKNVPRNFGRILLVSFLWMLISAAAPAAPKSVLWDRWTAHNPTSNAEIDHSAWTQVLKSSLQASPDGVNRLPYARMEKTHGRILDHYVAVLTATAISKHNRDQQRAYWINLYNAVTVQLVLDHYPVNSILDIDISPGFFTFGPWDKKLIDVEGESLSLNDIEHRILRPIWKDPRIHYAVNCASIGCPNLMPTAFTADNAEVLLDEGAVAYVNHPRGVEIIDGKPVTSSIYYWFKEDFGASDSGVLDHLRRYAAPRIRGRLASFTRLNGHSYDWRLNDTEKRE